LKEEIQQTYVGISMVQNFTPITIPFKILSFVFVGKKKKKLNLLKQGKSISH
jgi:hypothetical protein